MPKENRLDRVTDIALSRVQGAVNQVKKQFEGANPYRQEPVSPKQRLYEYTQLSPQDIEYARASFDPVAVDKYLSEMERMRLRYQEGK